MVGERLRNAFDREPIWRRVEEKVAGPFHNIRNKPGEVFQKRVPQFPNRNFGGGVTIGLVEAGIAIILEDTLGIPFGSETEAVGTRSTSQGTVYTVNVDAPTENMARAKAFLESNTGFTSILTDLFDVNEVEVLKTRTIRDTYQIEILVVD